MKKAAIAFLVFLVLGMTSCHFRRDAEPRGAASESSSLAGNKNPDSSVLDRMKLHEVLDISPETSYDNIEAFTECSAYATTVDRIECTVRDNNAGKGFYLYSTPYLDCQTNGSWVRLDYQPPYHEPSGWAFIGEEGNETKTNEDNLIFYPKYVAGKLNPGQYRLVLFVGKEVVYAPFSFDY